MHRLVLPLVYMKSVLAHTCTQHKNPHTVAITNITYGISIWYMIIILDVNIKLYGLLNCHVVVLINVPYTGTWYI